MRKTIAAGGLLVGAAFFAAAMLPAAAGPAAPTFKTTLLPGTSGFSEPRATILPNGERYVDTNATSGLEYIFRSTDGLHWTKTSNPPQQTVTTTDVDIVSTPSGRIVASELDYAGINFRTAYSDDQGKTWKVSNGTTYADTDRQWFAVGPNDPTTHKPRVYMLFHNLLAGTLSHNMFVATSKDGGATFGAPVPVAVPGQADWADLQCADSGGPSNIFADQRTGQVFVVFGTRSSPVGGCGAQPVEVNVVAANRVWVVEAAPGATATLGGWHPHLAVNDTGPPAHITGMQLAPGAIDNAGNVYVAYPESINDYPDYNGASIKVVHAAVGDLNHWSKPSVVAPSGNPGNILPHIVAGAAGKVDVAWYHGVAGPRNTIKWYSVAAQSLDALSATPHWQTVQLSDVLAEPSDQDSSALMGACLQGQTATLNGFYCGRAADVYGVALDSCGSLLVTWPAQAGLKSDGTYVSQQVGGPTLLPCKGASARVQQPATHRSTGPGLAATGSSPWAAGVGTGLLAFALAGLLVVRRRRAHSA